jgi:hypothetical protein
MRRKMIIMMIIIGIITVLIAGLGYTAHTLGLLDIIKNMHGG